MRRLAIMLALCPLCLAGSAGAQTAFGSGRAPVQRQPLVPLRAELLRPIGRAAYADTVRIRPDSAASAERASPATAVPGQVRSVRVCPMPVGRRDTTKAVDHMPVHRDSTRAASMPVATGCENPLFR